MSTSTSLDTITTSSIGEQKTTLLMLNILSLVRPIFSHIFQRLQPFQEPVVRTRIRGTKSMWRETRPWGWSSTTSPTTTGSPTSRFQTQRLRSSLSALMELQSTNIQEVYKHQSAPTISPNLCFKFQYTRGKASIRVNRKILILIQILHKGASPPVTLPPTTDPSRPLGR